MRIQGNRDQIYKFAFIKYMIQFDELQKTLKRIDGIEDRRQHAARTIRVMKGAV